MKVRMVISRPTLVWMDQECTVEANNLKEGIEKIARFADSNIKGNVKVKDLSITEGYFKKKLSYREYLSLIYFKTLVTNELVDLCVETGVNNYVLDENTLAQEDLETIYITYVKHYYKGRLIKLYDSVEDAFNGTGVPIYNIEISLKRNHPVKDGHKFKYFTKTYTKMKNFRV